MNFGFDPAKSEANVRKHGIDFLAAQAHWRGPVCWRSRQGPQVNCPAVEHGEQRGLQVLP